MQLRFGSRMRIGFLAMAVLLVGGGLITILYTYRLQAVTTRLLTDNLSSLEAAQELEVSLFRMRGLTSNYILDADPQWLVTLETRKREFRESLVKATQTARSAEETEALVRISALFSEYEHDLAAVLSLNADSRQQQAQHLLAHATREVFERIYEQCEKFVALNEGFVVDAIGRIEHSNRAVRLAMYGLAFSGIAMGYILGVVISKSILQPIYELVLKVRGAAGTEVIERLEVARGQEMEQLDHHVNELIRRVNTTRSDLEKNRRLLARADRLAGLGKISAGIAHEIRNPLSAIKMLSYSMSERLHGQPEMQRDLSVIIKEIDRADRFIQYFLTFARPPDPCYVPVRLKEVVEETLELLQPRLRQAQVETRQQLDDTALLMADPDQLRQLVMNLVLNAVEAMEPEGVLTVTTREVRERTGDAERNAVQLRISDTGPGIPDELLDNLFDPFVSGRDEGTGLGLAMSHQIVLCHNGWIDAVNGAEGGAIFTVTIPNERG